MTSTASVKAAHGLEAELLGLLARQGRRMPIPVFLAALMNAAMAYGRVPVFGLGAWLLLVVLVLAVRWAILGRLPTAPGLSDGARLRVAVALSGLNGCVQALSLAFFAALPDVQRAIQSLLLVGLCTGAVATTVGYRPIFLAFVVPVMAPLVAMWAWTGTNRHAGWIDGLTAVILVIFGALLFALANDSYRLFRESFEIRLQQARLNEQLNMALMAADAANHAKTRFLASASHDLRQPVHALTLFAAALSMQPLSEAGREIARHMDQALQMLSGQLEALLDISKLDAGIVEARPAALAAAPFLLRVHGEYLPAAQAKGLLLTVDLACTPVLMTDEVLLGRLVCNLVDNAIKYTEQGTVGLFLLEQDGDIVLGVSDTGRGIPLPEHERVFEEFYQLGNVERDQRRGLGLGLSIVRRLAQLLRIRLEMVSRPGLGTSFYLIIARHGQLAGADPPVRLPPASLPALHVLVVDDDDTVRSAMQALLQELGMQVVLAGGTAEARHAARRWRPDVLLVDFRLRGDDSGLATAAALRALHPQLPVILITGDTAPGRLREAADGGLLLLHKPVAVDVLRQALSDVSALSSGAPHG